MNEHVKKALESALTNAWDDLHRCQLQVKRAPGEASHYAFVMAARREQIAALEAELAK